MKIILSLLAVVTWVVVVVMLATSIAGVDGRRDDELRAAAYFAGQIAQASGTNTVQLVKQPNGEMKWEPTTKAGE